MSDHEGKVEEEEEPECRVCRGPEEEDHPLYKPCKCSGSIGWTHQDCLQSWLAVNNNASKCELCGHMFQFTNQYAPDTPERLPLIEVLLGVTRNLLATWLPLWLRIAVASALWLLAAPLLTALIYHGWLHGTMLFTGKSTFLLQLRWSVFADELVSGAVLVAFILFSFLSIMSFVDFLRAEWQDPRPQNRGAGAAPGEGAAARNNNLNRRGGPRGPARVGGPGAGIINQGIQHPLPNDADVDAVIWDDYVKRHRTDRGSDNANDGEEGEEYRSGDDAVNSSGGSHVSRNWNDGHGGDDDDSGNEEEKIADPDHGNVGPVPNDEEDRENIHRAAIVDLLDDDEEEEDDGEDEGEDDIRIENMADRVLENNDMARNVNNNNNNDDLLDDDPVLDADLNIALDELLGVRGPLWVVVRNLLWLLAFNTLYLALFAFVPRVIGAMAVSLLRAPLQGKAVPATDHISILANHISKLANQTSILANVSALASPTTDATNETAIVDDLNNFTTTTLSANETALVAESDAAIVATAAEVLISNLTGQLTSNLTTNLTDVISTVQEEAEQVTSISDYSLSGIFSAIEQESDRLDTTFRLKDFALVTIGYACAAITIVTLRYLWILARNNKAEHNHGAENNNNENGNMNDDRMRELMGEIGRVIERQGFGPEFQVALEDRLLRRQGAGQGQDINNNNNNMPFDDDGSVPIADAIEVMLDAAASIVKVGVLLFLKMFLLPVMLGFCLDLSTVGIFQRTFDEIILFAGQDLFSFLFLHWVAGISFMLLVTVSVLQLREVAHPNVLAHIIRPQEPQPDLLGNLLHEPLVTHGKRLVLSLVIYLLLLILQVHVPVNIFMLVMGGAQDYWKPKFCYVLEPRLQIPIELCIFHLCMLAFLEKNKNSIGEIQHYWLKFISGVMNLSHCLLPHEVERFHLVGTRKVYPEGHDKVDPLWYQLAKETGGNARQRLIDEMIRSSYFDGIPAVSVRVTPGETTMNGNRVIRIGSDFIRLPHEDGGDGSILLPTKSGRYRLNRCPTTVTKHTSQRSFFIELWVEVPGTAIPRPPEGWDDLGAGGADVQGRWAWDKEKKSYIEEGLAQRSVLYSQKNASSLIGKCIVTSKICFLILLSWVAGTVTSSILLVSPLVVGRILFSLLRLPENYVHDPFCFALGSSIVFPCLRRLMAFFKTSDQSIATRFFQWLGIARLPSFRKLVVLASAVLFWFGFMPAIIGLGYDALFLWPNDRFVARKVQWETKEVVLSWLFGNVLLSGWSACCVAGVLTREFWAAVFLNEPGRGDNDVRDPSSWQGSNGKMARFWGVWKAVLLGWEWDKVDSGILLDETIFPILRMLLLVLVVPGIATAVVAGWIVHQAYSVSVVAKSSTALFSMVYLALSCEDQLSRWFDAAHRMARDDRYLIGQLLMNYRD